MSLNLDQLKEEVLQDLSTEDFAVFRSRPGSIENVPMVFWDTEGHPGHRTFLNAARTAGSKLIVFASRAFTGEELDDSLEQLDQATLPREERRTVESGLRACRTYVGRTCSLELAFPYLGHMYVYQVVADWFDEFLNLTDLIDSSIDEEEDDNPSFGGYFSKN